jgi:hypothetical protein
LFAASVQHPGTLAVKVPSGHICLRYVTGGGDTIPGALLLSNVVVGEGQTVLAAIGGQSSAWKYSMRMYFNTTASGANVAGNVYNFPVLVRLSGSNFNFSQAQPQGSDIRFTKSNGAPLPYEIEIWDSAAGAAAVWVKVDTVYGSDSAQYITMYYGNSTAVNASNSAAVFDTGNGFNGVWHLDESGSGAANEYKDATANHIDGQGGSGSAAYVPTRVPGVIGRALDFDGIDDYITMSAHPCSLGTSNLTLSAWVKTTDTAGNQCIIGLAGTYRFRIMVDWSIWFGMWNSITWLDTSSSGPVVNDGAWHQVTVVFDRTGTEQLYIDGAPNVAKDISSTAQAVAAMDTVQIGFDDDSTVPLFFSGTIDEARLERVGRSPAWIKLSYENQRPDQRLVR